MRASQPLRRNRLEAPARDRWWQQGAVHKKGEWPVKYHVPIAAAWRPCMLAVASALALAASNGANAAGEVESVVWAGKNSVASLDPALSYDSGTNNYATYAECEGLFVFDADTKLQPLLADSFKKVDDKTYVVTLRKGPKFWDGKPITAGDVAYSITRINDPKLASPLAGLAST